MVQLFCLPGGGIWPGDGNIDSIPEHSSPVLNRLKWKSKKCECHIFASFSFEGHVHDSKLCPKFGFYITALVLWIIFSRHRWSSTTINFMWDRQFMKFFENEDSLTCVIKIKWNQEDTVHRKVFIFDIKRPTFIRTGSLD